MYLIFRRKNGHIMNSINQTKGKVVSFFLADIYKNISADPKSNRAGGTGTMVTLEIIAVPS